MAKSKTTEPRPSIFGEPRDPNTPWRCKVCSSPVRWVKTMEGGRPGIDHVDHEGPNAGQPHRNVCGHPHRSPWGRVAKCSTCSEHIVWAVTETGKRMPVDAAMRNDGNVRLVREADGTVRAVVGTITDELYGGQGFVSHFATCGQAAQHRRATAEAVAETATTGLGGGHDGPRPGKPATATGEETPAPLVEESPAHDARTATGGDAVPGDPPPPVAEAPSLFEQPAPWVACPGQCGVLIDPARELCVGCANGDTAAARARREAIAPSLPANVSPDHPEPDAGFVPDFEPCDFAPVVAPITVDSLLNGPEAKLAHAQRIRDLSHSIASTSRPTGEPAYDAAVAAVHAATKCALCPNAALIDGDTCQECRDTFAPDQPPDRQRVLLSSRQPSCLACDRCGATSPIGDGKADGALCATLDCGGWRTKAGGKLLDAGLLVLSGVTRDADAGKAAAQEGIDRADRAADLEWKVAAMMAVRQIARERREFTTDDVWERIPAVREPRALGAVMQKAAKAGVIEKSDRVRESDRPEAHSNPKAVWLSLTHTGDTTCH